MIYLLYVLFMLMVIIIHSGSIILIQRKCDSDS